MKKLVLVRTNRLPDRTLGRLFLFDHLGAETSRFFTLEPPWKDNRRNESCIPAGRYSVEPRSSQKFGDHLLVTGVPDRDLILIHAGNRPTDTEGCILVGLRFSDIDKDGRMDVASSKTALILLTQFVRDPASLVVVDA